MIYCEKTALDIKSELCSEASEVWSVQKLQNLATSTTTTTTLATAAPTTRTTTRTSTTAATTTRTRTTTRTSTTAAPTSNTSSLQENVSADEVEEEEELEEEEDEAKSDSGLQNVTGQILTSSDSLSIVSTILEQKGSSDYLVQIHLRSNQLQKRAKREAMDEMKICGNVTCVSYEIFTRTCTRFVNMGGTCTYPCGTDFCREVSRYTKIPEVHIYCEVECTSFITTLSYLMHASMFCLKFALFFC